VGILGDLPALVHRGADTPVLRTLLDRSGVKVPTGLATYGSVDEGIEMLRAAVASGRKPVLQHVPPAALPFESVTGTRTVLERLNDKALLAAFVPPAFVAERRVVPLASLDPATPPALPIVAKACAPTGSGGGNAVRICRTAEDWARALSHFRARAGDLHDVVLEEYIEFERTWCINLAIAPDGCAWRPLGDTVQVVSPSGQYVGSWHGRDFAAPPEAAPLTAALAEAARALGFRGIAGFDCGIDRTGRLFAFDLNFRLNASTPLLLLAGHAAARAGHAPATRLLRLTCRAPIAEIQRTVGPLVDRGEATMVGLFDGSLHAERPPWSRLVVILPGADAQAIEARAQALAARLDAVARPEHL
jgi:hypothetical protein